jgi:DNA repair exonuclease SbcCD nuclease subunit
MMSHQAYRTAVPIADLPPRAADGVRLVHTSDLHIGLVERHTHVEVLDLVTRIAERCAADVLLLLGDIFDHAEIADPVVDDAAGVLDRAHVPTAILPGNHDCLIGGRYMRGRFDGAQGVMIIDGPAVLPGCDLALWGRAHRDFLPVNPFQAIPARGPVRWHVGLGHGHFDRHGTDVEDPYRFGPGELDGHPFDYVALGHWDRFFEVAPAVYYSGSPQFTESVNVVDLTPAGVAVHRVSVDV